jgi:hypothetical protein
MMRTVLAGAVAVAVLGACGGDGVSGSSGEWIRGRALSVRVTATNMGGTLEVRNDAERDVAFAPLKITVGDQVVADLDAAGTEESVLEPGDSFTFPIFTGEEMGEVRVEMGSGADRETFTVTM